MKNKKKLVSLKPNHSDLNGSGRGGLEGLIRKSAKKHGTPLMLISKEALRKQYETLKRSLSNVEPFYAIKANPHPEIIKTFIKLGSGFDVASAAEMDTVLKLGASPDKIIFANTIKSNADLARAHKRKVTLMTFDNEAELYKIAKFCPNAKVLVRIKVDNTGSTVELSLKFGADPDQAIFLLKKAQSLGLKPMGVCFHVGSQCTNVENYMRALDVSSAIFSEAKKLGLNLTMLDIGGGFPIRHFDGDGHITIKHMAKLIRKKLKRLFDKGTRFIAEPGRFFSGPAGTLVTQVVGRTFRNNKNYYYLNDGVYGDFSGTVFDHCRYQFKTLRRGHKFLSTLAGPTCDSFDIISLNEDLPELDVGSVVYVKNIGAYSCASAVPAFNGFPPAKIVMV
ncbi:MAG: type III PLP-dependent enzyme [Candidatus Margulisbacteria bacterium]|nr:type III PLP-dependent enzyme [Candidatus Margulisiibacteriota bacterium]MBU1021218.1 type III PLP-dependent enzyme [Candidatus Margulisiibacteriota bacterium]MBU1729824.1 type III PLP-dependent enzyme [Candidatus Margulisiibacteriota bacterium]MBU1955325.1 type III PLP-dependent enzyme [Candidatus Margulisiibacteriota bacterium]